ncbi:hypothetical protein PH7735_00806 [Shimia thalassica]|uniref:Uncharacterized protein n=1 Tax=Shimia thalassica TaxID=1715693 RepID=A0A0P1INL8_9RHOB|nr:hypothetical protein [Shimia thalassica]CUJ87711.1 hypothetical protein PH7735_00806 [Shimia thalassica]
MNISGQAEKAGGLLFAAADEMADIARQLPPGPDREMLKGAERTFFNEGFFTVLANLSEFGATQEPTE